MRHFFIPVLLALICFSSYSQTGPGAMLPEGTEVPGWRPAGELKVYNSENLNNLADERADLIREYGFRQAIAMDFYNYYGKLINIQVFTMDNTFGSYGIFLQKSKGGKIFDEFGNSCFEKTDSFGFWKQFYFIYMHSDFEGDTIAEGFRLIARVIDSKIKSKGLFPDILGLSKNKKGNVTIFKGPLALSNIYYFSPSNIFFINEGIAIENSDSKEIILKYADNNEAVRRLSDAAGILGAMTKFSDFNMVGEFSFAMKDREGKTLVFKVNEDCLDITIE